MDTTRWRLKSFGEWVVATAFLAGLLAIGLNLATGIRRVGPLTPVSQRIPDALPAPSAVPPRAVSVPLLSLSDNVRIQVGEFATDVLSRIRGLVDVGVDVVERRGNGERSTREFRHAGGRFFLVTEPDADAMPRVTGIFIP